MDRRVIGVLTVAITLALAGLVFIQTLWVRNTIELRDAQFGESVDNALIAVSDRLERIEALSGIRDHAEGRRVFQRLDSLKQERTELEEAHAPHMVEAHDGGQHLLIQPEETGVHGRMDSLHGELDAAEMLGDSLVGEIVRGVLSAQFFRDINDRIDPLLLDSLITDELERRHITGRHEHGVFGESGTTVLLSLWNEPDAGKVKDSPHRVELFRNDMAGDTHWLHVYMPEQQRFVLRSLWPMLTASGIFLLLIVLAFVYTIRTIWQQKRLSDIRNDLVNNLTHELKTPISTIALACEALNDPSMPKSPDQMKLFTGMIRDENKRLGLLVENVLQSAVVNSGRMVLRLSNVDMHNVLSEVVRHSAIQAENRGGSIELKMDAELAHVTGDRIHLTNVFYNLIDNAVKYCEREPRIAISTRSDAKAIIVSVRDNGIGIPRTEQKKIFDRLYRVPTGDRHNVKGFGLGLSYVKSVVERHSGSIRVESEPGTGSVFHITIPFEHGDPDKAAVV